MALASATSILVAPFGLSLMTFTTPEYSGQKTPKRTACSWTPFPAWAPGFPTILVSAGPAPRSTTFDTFSEIGAEIR